MPLMSGTKKWKFCDWSVILLKLFVVIARNSDGVVVQISDPHSLVDCFSRFVEYLERDDVSSCEIYRASF